jgi:CMP-N,N'-diacetyllegionaminic acid synthase
MTEKLLCTIPARAGSKRLPGKNLLPLAGKPLIAYSITSALASDLFQDVFVCTEDQVIADTAVRFGAKVPVLVPGELCGDEVGSNVPCEYVADHLAQLGRPSDVLVCLQPTSPLRSAEDIRSGVSRFLQGDLHFLVSVTQIDPHYFHWAVVPGENGDWRMSFGDKYLVERQMLPPVYRPNGSIKIARLQALRELGHFFGPRLGAIETPEERSVHVATQFEFDLCEFLLRKGG